jgi:hypothetical protein
MSYAVSPPDFDLDRARGDISEWDQTVFLDLVTTDLTAEQAARVTHPDNLHPRQKEVMAIHWHPEWIPLDLITERIDRMFPQKESELIIPTQHNQLMTLGDYAGVEMDCYSSGFKTKVQLLLHFRADRVAEAGVLKSMLDHTFKYRSGQLFNFMEAIVKPEYESWLREAASQTGANEHLVALVRFYTARLRQLIYEHEAVISAEMIKNKLLSEYIDAQRERHPDPMINRALLLVKAVKKIVKDNFPLDYFFRASEVIEETKALGGCVTIPHPEQFWPILLADYDVDGWEVWNPQSQAYTDFLIRALINQNKIPRPGRRDLLVFMGDDTHMSVKVRDPQTQEKSKLEREIGLQPAWDDIVIRKSLSLGNVHRAGIIEMYKERLG